LEKLEKEQKEEYETDDDDDDVISEGMPISSTIGSDKKFLEECEKKHQDVNVPQKILKSVMNTFSEFLNDDEPCDPYNILSKYYDTPDDNWALVSFDQTTEEGTYYNALTDQVKVFKTQKFHAQSSNGSEDKDKNLLNKKNKKKEKQQEKKKQKKLEEKIAKQTARFQTISENESDHETQSENDADTSESETDNKGDEPKGIYDKIFSRDVSTYDVTPTKMKLDKYVQYIRIIFGSLITVGKLGNNDVLSSPPVQLFLKSVVSFATIFSKNFSMKFHEKEEAYYFIKKKLMGGGGGKVSASSSKTVVAAAAAPMEVE